MEASRLSEVYPRSCGETAGDVNGGTARLDDLRKLGVGATWIALSLLRRPENQTRDECGLGVLTGCTRNMDRCRRG